VQLPLDWTIPVRLGGARRENLAAISQLGTTGRRSFSDTRHWELLGNGSDRKMRLSWRESGGPPVTAPQRKGFGSVLIEQGLVGYGESFLDFRPDGLRCSLELSHN
jgi:two-component sensor histidine kinase